MSRPDQPVQPGEPAPDFAVPAVQEDRTISLADYRGKAPVLLGLFPGLYCPFCRRSLARMAATADQLKTLGVDSLAIVGTELDNARLYFKYRPTRIALGADPELATHRSYGVPRPEPTEDLVRMVTGTLINPFDELPQPMPVPEAGAVLNARDGFQPTPTDEREGQSTFTQMKGQFLIDGAGIVRWANIECGKDGLAGLGKFPSHDELISAATTALRGAPASR